MAFQLGMRMWMAYYMLISMTLTLMQGHNGLAAGKKPALNYLDN